MLDPGASMEPFWAPDSIGYTDACFLLAVGPFLFLWIGKINNKSKNKYFHDCFFKMKHDFKKMEEEMTELEKNMSAITDFSEKISGTLQDKRQQITKLSGVHTLLTKVLY